MDPSGLVSPDCPTMIRYLERFGSFGKQKNLALVAWMTALAGDQLARGAAEAASDTIALLQLVVDQACLDGGDFTFARVLGLQQDLTIGVFQDVAGSGPATRAFSPLAEQRWVTVALSYLNLQGFACQPHEPQSIREDSVTAEFEIGQTQNKELRRKEIPRRCIVGIGTAFGRGTIVRNCKAMAN